MPMLRASLVTTFFSACMRFSLLWKMEVPQLGRSHVLHHHHHHRHHHHYHHHHHPEMQKAASMASALVLFFPPAVLIFRLSTRKMCFFLSICNGCIGTIGTSVLIFLSLLTFGLCMHKISTASVAGRLYN